MTKKVGGYAPAEQDPISWHAVPKFDPKTGTLPKSPNARPTFSKIFGDWLCEEAATDEKLMAITLLCVKALVWCAFLKSTPHNTLMSQLRSNYAVTFAAGLVIGGYKPIVAIYSTFLQRAYDQVIHDVAIQNSRYSLLSIVAALLVRMVRPTKELLISLFLTLYP